MASVYLFQVSMATQMKNSLLFSGSCDRSKAPGVLHPTPKNKSKGRPLLMWSSEKNSLWCLQKTPRQTILRLASRRHTFQLKPNKNHLLTPTKALGLLKEQLSFQSPRNLWGENFHFPILPGAKPPGLKGRQFAEFFGGIETTTFW